MKILIAGARGTLGSRVTRLLNADGHEVVGMTRNLEAGPGFVVADVLDRAATIRAVAEVAPDVIVQTLNALPKAGPKRAEDLAATGLLRVEGTRNLLAAARAAGVRRYVSENFCFVYGGTPVGSAPVTEDYPLDAGTDVTRSQDEQVRDHGGVVLRCGLFYGHGVGSTDYLAGLVRRRRAPVIKGARNAYSYLHIDDAATAVVAAIERGTPGAAYNIADDVPAGPHDLIRALAAAVQAPNPFVLPAAVIRPLAGGYLMSSLTGNLTISNARARAELGWVPSYPSLREGLGSPVPGRISSAM